VHHAPFVEGLCQHEAARRGVEKRLPHHGFDGWIAARQHLAKAQDEVVAIDLQHGIRRKETGVDVGQDGLALAKQPLGKLLLPASQLRYGSLRHKMGGHGGVQHGARALGLCQQHGERRDLEIPLDQGGNGALAADLVIEGPHRFAHRRAVGIDIEVPLRQDRSVKPAR
jgi:hypothetical protein